MDVQVRCLSTGPLHLFSVRSSVGRVPLSCRGSRQFDPVILDIWVHSSAAEQRPFKPLVGGSNPPGLTIPKKQRPVYGGLAEWSKALVSKTRGPQKVPTVRIGCLLPTRQSSPRAHLETGRCQRSRSDHRITSFTYLHRWQHGSIAQW